MSDNLLYPSFLKLDNRKVIVVGGGFVAYQKLASLIETKAKLVVISPSVIDELRELEGEFPNKRFINFIERDYEWGDEKDAFMVIAATNVSELNNSILNRCKDQGILVLSVDNPEDSDFFVPSIANYQGIKVAISTNGQAPALAQALRKFIQDRLLKPFAKYLPMVNDFRKSMKLKYSDDKKRTKLVRQFTERQLRKIEKVLDHAQ